METIIGFIAGYLTGMSEGRDGLKRARASLEAIRNSPEFRRLVSDAVTATQGLAGRTAKGGLSSAVSGVGELITSRAAARGQRAA
ncbi:MAG TPA: hypothetical protein VMH35_00430 [Streptosporangiaceae bacterium]|nr:hypothetical protein [Streptosporangiaceae bacterium]